MANRWTKTAQMQGKIRKIKIATKKIRENIGSSQHKSCNKQKKQLLDNNSRTTKMQIIPKHDNIKTMTKKLQNDQAHGNKKKFD